MSIIGSNILAGASGQAGYNLNNSLRFRASNSARLSRTFGTTGTNNKIQTFSAWVKRGLLSSSTDYRLMGCYDGSSANSTEINFDNDSLRIEFGGAANNPVITTQVFRDPSAWYHIVIAIDTTQATASNRIKMYVNGTQVTAFSTATYPAQNAASQLTSANANNSIGSGWSGFEYFDGYMTEINFVDGQALTPSSFGETSATTGQWIPKKYTSTYGTNGFYLKFADASAATAAAIGKDSSGNSNNWTPSGISVTAGVTYDAMLDVPTNTSATVANYCTWNPLTFRISAATTFSNANLTSTFAGGGYATAYGTIAVTSGKYYWEVTVDTVGGDSQIGISEAVSIDSTSAVYRVYRSSGQKQTTGNVSSAYGSSYTTSDIIGVALDIDSGTITFYKNNTSQGTAFTDIASALPSTGWTPYGYGYSGNVLSANFGQRPFTYTAPSGFVALNTYNLPTPTILQGNKYMDATLWTGNGSAQTIVNQGQFKSDLVWVKSRSNTFNNNLFNSISGVNKFLVSDTTAAEASVSGTLTAFNSNGFSVGSDIGLNFSGGTYVGWQWQAGQGSTVSNTSGSITSTVSASTTAGFSIVSYTGNGTAGATVGHGLGVSPVMTIIKSRLIGTNSWCVWQKSFSTTQTLYLDATSALLTRDRMTGVSSTTFTIGSHTEVNTSSSTYVAYCWAEIAGFSAFGSYTGNGSADGPFIFTGFRPKYVMWKRTDTAGFDWDMYDSSRDTYNLAFKELIANSSAAESTSTVLSLDILSNGFKLRTSNGNGNASGGTYIYMAFAENPFKNSNAR